MLKFFFVTLISVQFSVLGMCQKPTVEQQVTDLSKRKFEWMIHKNLDSLNALLDENIKYIHSNGWIQTKQEIITDFKTGKLILKQVDVTESEVRLYNNTAILTGKGMFTGTINDKEFSLNLFYTEVYIYKENKWLLTSRHACKLQ